MGIFQKSIYWATALGLSLWLAGCRLAAATPSLSPTDLPDREIAFFVGTSTLGFIHADGSGYVTRTVELNAKNLVGDFLSWSPDGQTLLARYLSYPPNTGVLLQIGAEAKVLACSLNLTEDTPSSQGRAWLTTGTTLLTTDGWRNHKPVRLLQWDMQTCTETGQITAPALTPAPITIEEATRSAQDWLAVAHTDATYAKTLSIVDATGVEVFTLPGADAPAWSRDGAWLAYRVYKSGLFVARQDGSEQHQVLDSDNVSAPAWSPDGQWLVYYRVKSPGIVSVYKLEIATGQEVELFEGGTNPAWRWMETQAP